MSTVKVLAAVKDDNKGYKPDEKSRTAWDLATHIATSDVWFLDGIVNGKFAQGGDTPTFNSVNEVVEFYKKAYPAKIAEIRRNKDVHGSRPCQTAVASPGRVGT